MTYLGGLMVFLASVNMMLSRPPCMPVPVRPSGQPSGLPESPYLGLLPPAWVRGTLFKYKPANPESTHHLSHGLSYLPLATCSSHAKTRYQKTRGAPVSQSPLKFFKLASPKLADPASSVLPHRNHSTGSYSHVPLSLCLLANPGTS